MTKYEFSIIASGLNPEVEDFEQRFLDAGCDDATISFQKGHIIADFAREAASIDSAIVSAVECVNSAGATVDRVEPDPLVSLSDIASRTGMSRAAMTQYSKGQRSRDFPSPVARVTSDSPLWDWATVAKWLFQHGKISRETAMEAAAVRAANVAIELHQPKLLEAMQDSLQSYAEDLENRAA
jgi:predicted DNA-binding transcriptional regulator AlpA